MRRASTNTHQRRTLPVEAVPPLKGNGTGLVARRRHGRILMRHGRGCGWLPALACGLLVSVAASFFGACSRGRWDAPRRGLLEVERVYQAAAEYMSRGLGSGDCPAAEDLTRTGILPSRWSIDSWGGSFAIRCDGVRPSEVRSAGPDGQMGTEDDVVYSESLEERPLPNG